MFHAMILGMSTNPAELPQRRLRPRDTWGARLAQLRYDLQMSQGEIATLCGLPPATWSTWERGVVPRDKAEITRRIARATGYDLDWLLWGEPDGSGPTTPGGPAAEIGTGRFQVRVPAQELKYRTNTPFRLIKVPA